MQQKIFEGFDKISNQDWEEKMVSDLKGKSIDSLHWYLNNDFCIKAFYTAKDVQNIDFPILRTNNPDWQIGEIIRIQDYKKANQEALDVLMKGVTAITFHFCSLPIWDEFELLFKDIGIEYIATHFSFDLDFKDRASFIALWQKLLSSRKLNSAKVYFEFDSEQVIHEKKGKHLAEIISKNLAKDMSMIHINCKEFYTCDEQIDRELKNSIAQMKACIEHFKRLGVSVEKLTQHCFFTVQISMSFLLEIAKIRALKLLYIELLQSYGIKTPKLPFVKVEFASNAYGESPDDNLINGTSLCMSSVLGGANHIMVRPINASKKATRLARNIQLILKHESGFDLVADPMAGSYYVESITQGLIDKVKEKKD